MGDDEWWDFQTDGYGTWLWALSEHVRRGGTMDPAWLDAVRLTAGFLVETWDLPCFDWWEEHDERRHVSTLGCVIVGLERAVQENWLPAEEAALRRRTPHAPRVGSSTPRDCTTAGSPSGSAALPSTAAWPR